MTSDEFRNRLLARAENAEVVIPADAQLQLEAYFRLLAKWNAKINLTALPLLRPTDETFDRLLIEPWVAARHVALFAGCWFDVGSGGGSPAIPLKIAQPLTELTMIESKARKAAFLREVVRALGLADAAVENRRFEEVVDRTRSQTVDLVTVRAVRSDTSLFSGIHRVLSPIGRVFLFRSSSNDLNVPSLFKLLELAKLGSGDARLAVLKPVFHVEHRDE